MDRLFSLVMVALVGVFILSLLLVSVVLGAFSDWLTANFAFGLALMFPILDLIFSVALITVLFAAIFRFLPDINPPMRDVWPGALITALLFVIAKFALGYYLGRSDQGSAYGTAGSIILIMVWTSYCGLILVYGSAFIKVLAQWKGRMGQGTIKYL
jgi:membrane protein